MAVPDQRLRLPQLLEYRARALARRAEAFCDAPEFVIGIPVNPLTPATFSMLLATKSAFLSGGSATENDVINYLWFHSPLYSHTGVQGWRQRKRLALARYSFEMGQPWRKWVGLKPDRNRQRSALVNAITEIRKLVTDAFADAPAASGRPGKPIATLEAFFIHEFAVAYHWMPEQTRHTPLRQVIQLHRCIRSSRGDEVSDDGEDRILAEHLRKRNDALAAERERRAAA